MKHVRFLSFWLLLALGTATVCGQDNTSTTDKGVVINGVKWATRNVDAPGTFAANPEDAGMFYQWNRKKAWAVTGEVTGWDATYPQGDSWAKSNDPSPVGWHVPTGEDIKKLLDASKVRAEWTSENGVPGEKFTDKATGNSIFLPAVGARKNSNNPEGAGTEGNCWSSSESGMSALASGFNFNNDVNPTVSQSHRRSALSVRPVAD